MKNTTRAAAVAVATFVAAAVSSSPAFADRLASAPGFASTSASCVGSVMTFAAHYGAEGESYPQIVHGAVGPVVSADASGGPAGVVGAFNRSLAQNSGSILVCVP